ncbi:TetR/AcrR family transcriptional regulator [Streptosporangium roseum]|uniref:TetR/AcrR family transcriptional regulator n=1 Tax=Streptosporangium roseum TaxID=2001 RepID=UPI0033241392
MPEQPLRADARRNFDKIIKAACAVVAERGIGAPMELIARRAGVGVGTLYRRFPDRGALITAIGDHYIHELVDAARRATETGPDAWTALRSLVIWCADPGRGALATALADLDTETFLSTPEFARSREEWIELLDGLVRGAQAAGAMRTDAGTGDIVMLLNVFTCHPAELPAHVAAQPARFLHLMLDGLRAGGTTELPGEPAPL